jgi:hypothetical protein
MSTGDEAIALSLTEALFGLTCFVSPPSAVTPHGSCDVKLYSANHGAVFWGHRDFLSARSPALRGVMYGDDSGVAAPLSLVLGHQPAEAAVGPVRASLVLPCAADVLRSLTVYLYTDVCRIPSTEEGELQEYLEVASLLLLHPLCSFISQVQQSLHHTPGHYPHIEPRSTSMESQLLEMATDPVMCDVSIVTADGEGAPILASRSILAAVSDFFREAFSGRWADSHQRNTCGRTVFTLPEDIHWGTTKDLLQFVYSQDLELHWIAPQQGRYLTHRVLDLLRSSQFFLMPTLFDACQAYLIAHLTDTNVCETWAASLPLGALEVHDAAKKYFIHNFAPVSDTDGYLHLSKDLLRSALAAGCIQADMSFVTKALLRWASRQLSTHSGVSVGPRLPTPSKTMCYDYVEDLLPPNTLFTLEHRRLLLGVNRILM